MKKFRILALILTFLLTLMLAGAVLAQEGVEDPPDPVTGTYDHPIVDLLDTYFGDDESAEEWAEALETLTLDEGVVTDVNELTDELGNTTWEVTLEDGSTFITNDEELAAALIAALAVAEAGEPTAVGDEIAAYHEDGLGFGVLVKLYAIAGESATACEEDPDPECAVTVAQLVGDFQGGMGMGQIFREYGRPSLMGVGHVRQALRAEGLWQPGDGSTDGDDDDVSDGDGTEGICNARAHGGGALAHGHGEVECP